MSTHATGSFEVKLTPQPLAEAGADPSLGRMGLAKVYTGDLTGTAIGEMLMAGTVVKGSAGYVAIEHVSGTLNGRTGSFALQHLGTMNRGQPALAINVVPDSGTGELTGLSGQFMIIIEGGKHLYEFDYTIAGQE